MTYDELYNYPNNCELKVEQLKELQYVQRVKNFNPDITQLSAEDRTYNSRLKATIWWYTYRCDQ